MSRGTGLRVSWVAAVHCTQSLPLLTLWALTITVASSVSLLFLPLLPLTPSPPFPPPFGAFHHLLGLPRFPRSTRPQLGSATVGCKAALRAPSATACIRVPGQGPSLQTSMRPFIIWTGCSTVSLQHRCMVVFSGCDEQSVLLWCFESSFGVCLIL